MRIVDLSHSIAPGMPVYPGTEPPIFRQSRTMARDGFAEKRISLHAHTETHVDAPSHILVGGRTVDEMPVDSFIGPALVLDASHSAAHEIGLPLLQSAEEVLREAEFCSSTPAGHGAGSSLRI